MPIDPPEGYPGNAQIETLDDTGFTFEQIGLQARRKSANFGDGYTAGARIGHVEGLRAWRIKIDVLPDFLVGCSESYLETRARYLWEFWRRHKLEKDSEIFLMRDPFPADPTRTQDRVFARFVEDELNYPLTTEYVFSCELTIRQCRIPNLSATDFNPHSI
jgi:hypothetical protein